MTVSKRIRNIEPFPMLSAVGIIIALVVLFVRNPFTLKEKPVIIYTYSDIYYLTKDSLTAESGKIHFHDDYQILKDSLTSLTAIDAQRCGFHTCTDDSTHTTCDSTCICDSFNCSQSKYEN